MFDVAVGERAISHMGHLKMMGAVQPFISGAISKTVNLPQTATVEDIADAYTQAWRLGIKALAIYRDGSKTAQALRTDAQKARPGAQRRTRGGTSSRRVGKALAEAGPRRKRMPRERQSITHKFSIGGHEGYITAGMYEDGTVGEIFLTDIGKEGSTLRGMMNSFATAISIALQYGVPLETLVQKFSYMRFEPEGITGNPEIPFAKSMPDYIMRWLASRFLDTDAPGGTRHPHPGGAGPQGGPGGRESVRLLRHTAARPRHRSPASAAAAAPQPRRARLTDSPAGRPGPHAGSGSRPGLQPVRRHDAAHGLVLHVLQLRQQHRLRLSHEAGAYLRPRPLMCRAHGARPCLPVPSMGVPRRGTSLICLVLVAQWPGKVTQDLASAGLPTRTAQRPVAATCSATATRASSRLSMLMKTAAKAMPKTRNSTKHMPAPASC